MLKYALLVPCYNAQRFIEPFLESIRNQVLPFDEVLFYDDASTDNTALLLEKNGCKVIKGNTNRGPGYARNILAQAASADYIHYHDIDDELCPTYLLETSKKASESNYDVVLCNVDWYNATKTEVILKWHYSNTAINQNPLVYTINNPIGGINGLYNKNFFLTTGGFNTDARIWEDADLHVMLAAAGARFYIIEKVLSISLRHDNTVSADQVTGWATRYQFLESYAAAFKSAEVLKAVAEQAQMVASIFILNKKVPDAKKALYLSERCGLKVPNSSHILWNFAKIVLPASARISLRIRQLNKSFKNSGQQI